MHGANRLGGAIRSPRSSCSAVAPVPTPRRSPRRGTSRSTRDADRCRRRRAGVRDPQSPRNRASTPAGGARQDVDDVRVSFGTNPGSSAARDIGESPTPPTPPGCRSRYGDRCRRRVAGRTAGSLVPEARSKLVRATARRLEGRRLGQWRLTATWTQDRRVFDRCGWNVLPGPYAPTRICHTNVAPHRDGRVQRTRPITRCRLDR